MKIDTRNPVMIHIAGAAVVLAITAVLAMLVVVPIWQRQGDRARLSQEVSTRIGEVERLERAKRALATQLGQTNDAADRAALNLKTSRDLNEHLASITELAEKSGVQVESLEPATPTANAKFRGQPIRLSGKAGYLATQAFFERLRAQLPDTGIRAFQMRTDNIGNPPIATISMDLLWITKPDVAAPVSAKK